MPGMLVPKTRGSVPNEARLGSSSTERPTTAFRRRLNSRSRRRQAASASTVAVAVLSFVPRTAAEPVLPYTPTSILLPADDSGDRTAYIFAPTGDSYTAVDFLSLDVSKLEASSIKPTKLTSTLPFLASDAGNCTTFAPSLFRNGTIAVLAGDCTAGSTSSLWTYTPAAPSSKSKPSWTRHPLTAAASWDNAQSGPYHLGGMLSFSAQLSPVLSEPTLYLYGGMCPSPDSWSSGSSSSWQSKATYSNRMLRLTPSPSQSSSQSATPQPQPQPYKLTYATPTGQQPPVAEAGFTLTELAPSLSNRSGGIVTQQTSHVLLGGHTQSAFVNMSTAAVWSLPEETWSFVGIAPPSSSGTGGKAEGRGDGAGVKVDSRSGHSAVLSEDGTRLVVYGGWVGDVSTAAAPQLAVVKVGVGLGDWEWEVPEQGAGGGGVYGHGAAVLPGNVMMVYGGYEIGAGGGVKRRETGQARMFYNITSGSWSNEYVLPVTGVNGGSGGSSGGSGSGSGSGNGSGSVHGGSGNDSGSSSGTSGDGSSTSDDSARKRQIGLGVGLGVGLLVLVILAALGVRWFRRRQQRRAARDETLRSLSQGVNGSLPRGIGEDDEMLEQNHGMGMFPWTAAAAREWYTGGDDPYAQGRRSLGYETLRTGSRPAPSSLYIPPPPAASTFSSRPRGAKGLYQPTTGSSYDFTPLTGAPNRIDPIYEADEDEEADIAKAYPLSPDREERDDDDPFLTPTLNTPVGALFPSSATNPSSRNSNSPTPPPAPQTRPRAGTGGSEQHPDVQGWVSNVDAASSTTLPPARTLQRHTSTASSTTVTATGAIPALAARGPSTRSARHHHHHHAPVSPSLPTDSSSSSSIAAGDDSRTGSNLSERSTGAFSFTRGTGGGGGGGGGAEDRVLLSRLRTTLATTTTTTTTTTPNERGGSSGSGSGSNSGNSYNTARSNFAALQAEGPSLLLGRPQQQNQQQQYDPEGHMGLEEEDDYVYLPGSPSKHKPPRRSWFGSLKRVFSAASSTPDSSSGGSRVSREGSPTREGLLLWSDAPGGGGGEEYGVGVGVGAGAGGSLLHRRRRQQGREAWLGGHEGGDRDEEEWDRDLERAAEQRTVQIMFTVPREQLRVVNAEVEREESVLIVDPDDEEEEEEEDGGEVGSGGSERNSRNGEGVEEEEGRREQEQEQEQAQAQEPGLLRPPRRDGAGAGAGAGEEDDKAADRLSTATLELPAGGASPSPSLRASSMTSTTTLHMAEVVRLERPRTRVLAMVESFESRSREGSREGSPERGP